MIYSDRTDKALGRRLRIKNFFDILRFLLIIAILSFVIYLIVR